MLFKCIYRSLIDLNRAGTGLMELVFEPDLCNGLEAASLVKELLLIFERIKTCSGRMEGIVFLYLNIYILTIIKCVYESGYRNVW